MFIESFLAEHNLKISKVLNIYVDIETAIQRMHTRQQEQNRLDDNLEAFQIRISEFENNTKPLLDGIDCVIIDGLKKPQEVFYDIMYYI